MDMLSKSSPTTSTRYTSPTTDVAEATDGVIS
jgi:hypothetical protein